MKLIDELKRRNVFQIGVAYAVLGWLMIQVTSTVAPALQLPEWTLALVTLLVLVGLPFAIFLAWTYQLTPGAAAGGDSSDSSESTPDAAHKRLDLLVIALLLITIVVVAWEVLVLSDDVEVVTLVGGG